MDETYIVYVTDDRYYTAPEGILKYCSPYIYFKGSKEQCIEYCNDHNPDLTELVLTLGEPREQQ